MQLQKRPLGTRNLSECGRTKMQCHPNNHPHVSILATEMLVEMAHLPNLYLPELMPGMVSRFNQVAVVGLKANHQSTAVPSPNNGAKMLLPKRGAAANLAVGRLVFPPDVDLGKGR